LTLGRQLWQAKYIPLVGSYTCRMADEITINAVDPIHELVERPLRFEPPLIELAQNRESYLFWWRQIEAIFEMRDPREIPPLSALASESEDRVLVRYVQKAKELATTTVLGADDGMTVHVSDDGKSEKIVERRSPPDIIAGFAAIFRQFYANQEEASFSAVKAIAFQAALGAADAPGALRLDELKIWGKAAGKLRMHSMHRLGLEKLVEEGRLAPLPEITAGQYPDPEYPAQVISSYFYGEHLHWGDKAPVLEKQATDPFTDARGRLFFLESAAGLSHIYIGFAVLLEHLFQLDVLHHPTMMSGE